MKTVLVLVFTSALFISCQKELNFDIVAGNSACKACSYIPFCDGSVYVYSDTTGGVGIDVTDTVNIIRDTSIDGKVYQKFSNALTDGFYNCESGVSTVLLLNVLSAGGAIPRLEQTLLKANSPVGATWSNTVSTPVADIVYNSRIEEKGISKTLLGVTYNDVIHVRSVLSTAIGGIPIVLGESHFYYANNIGLIESITSSSGITGPPVVVNHRVLKTYSIP